MKQIFIKLSAIMVFTLLLTSAILGAESGRHVSAQYAALAPNAGGQTSYTLRYAETNWEIGAFSNQYLQAGNYPLSGVFYEIIMPLCKSACFWKFNLQAGAGLSNGGPFTQVTWSSIIPLLPVWLPLKAPNYIPALRLDITTQMIFIPYRAITWSYPLWAGISYPF